MSFKDTLLEWYKTNRRNLPWRETTNPYPVHLSEVILQQTKVDQGINYYQIILESYPTVHDLANADEQDILKLWQGLGYYSRAMNLLKGAKQICEDYDGNYPQEYSELLKISGIGKYTAAAIASICFDKPVAAIDGNAFRVYARYFDIHEDIAKAGTFKYFFELGNEVVPKKQAGDWNQAIMELGAVVCKPKNPDCDLCPWQNSCAGKANGTYLDLPLKTKKPKVKSITINYLVMEKNGKLMMRKRGSDSFWKNLYDFPELTPANESMLADGELEPIFQTTHLLSHRRLALNFWKSEFIPMERDATAWIHKTEMDAIPSPKPIADFLEKFFKG